MTERPLVYFFSDFGCHGPYIGQVEAIVRHQGQADFIDLLNNAPPTRPEPASYLLSAIYRQLPVKNGYLLAVVDPGVGSERRFVSCRHEQMVLLAPDNGLLAGIVRNHGISEVRVHSPPRHSLSSSFHARDWFAPLLVDMIMDRDIHFTPAPASSLVGHDWPEQLAEVIYIDHYGNLVTGLIASDIPKHITIGLPGSKPIKSATTFASVKPGELFWYENSMGLLEIAANQQNAAELCQADISTKVFLQNA